MNPLVSVIMPVYREEPAWLREAIQSIQKQTYKQWELIIVLDDPHNGALKKILQTATAKEKRIKLLVNKKNIGRGASRNRALEHARGMYIAILDADDVAFPTRLAEQVAFFTKHPKTGLLFTWATYINEKSKKIADFRPPEAWFVNIRKYFFTSHCCVHSTMMAPARIVKAVKYDPTFARSQDYEFWTRCMAEGYNFSLLPKQLVAYRIPPKEKYTLRVEKQRMFAKYAAKIFLKHLPSFATNIWYVQRTVVALLFYAGLRITPKPLLARYVRWQDH